MDPNLSESKIHEAWTNKGKIYCHLKASGPNFEWKVAKRCHGTKLESSKYGAKYLVQEKLLTTANNWRRETDQEKAKRSYISERMEYYLVSDSILNYHIVSSWSHFHRSSMAEIDQSNDIQTMYCWLAVHNKMIYTC